MIPAKRLLFILFLCCLSAKINAQVITIDIDDTRTGHRLFFHEHRNSEIFSQDKEKKFSKISSLLREIELHTILDKKSLSNNTHKKVKI